jgi:hypothetical protein
MSKQIITTKNRKKELTKRFTNVSGTGTERVGRWHMAVF